ncbi:hypothetical protein ACXR2W_01035 [Leucobacter sp. HY1908]
MTGGVFGGGVIFVVAALLWGAVFIPSWTRRREFRAAERNALRLQRTLRVLAETAEMPEEVRIEATAKEALAHEKMLKTARKQLDAERAAELADARAEQVRAEIRAQQMKRKERAAVRSSRLRRPFVRRVRATAALGALLGLLGSLTGAGIAIAGAGANTLVWSLLVTATSFGALMLLAPGRGRAQVLPVEIEVCEEAAQLPAQPEEVMDEVDVEAQAAAHRQAQQAAAERIERARALARARAVKQATSLENQTDSMLLRESAPQASATSATSQASHSQTSRAQRVAPAQPVPAQTAPAQTVEAQQPAREVAAVRRQHQAPRVSPQQQAARERLRQMGVVGDTSDGMLNLDDVLRRRRSG